MRAAHLCRMPGAGAARAIEPFARLPTLPAFPRINPTDQALDDDQHECVGDLRLRDLAKVRRPPIWIDTVRLLRLLTGLVLIVLGVIAIWPQIDAYWRYTVTTGEILDVFTVDQPGDLVRLEVVFQFPVPARSGHAASSTFGYGQADDRFHMIDDPVVKRADVPALTRSLLGDDPRIRPQRRIFYRPDDPAGTAFFVSEAAGRPGHRYEFGLALLATGLLLTLFSVGRNG